MSKMGWFWVVSVSKSLEITPIDRAPTNSYCVPIYVILGGYEGYAYPHSKKWGYAYPSYPPKMTPMSVP